MGSQCIEDISSHIYISGINIKKHKMLAFPHSYWFFIVAKLQNCFTYIERKNSMSPGNEKWWWMERQNT